jgi:VanZ family protein
VTRFALPVLASASLILAAPFIGQLRAALQSAFPGEYTRIVAAIVSALVAAALVAALVRIRHRRALRYGCVAAALVLGIGYATASRTGDPTVDVVERFHFVEYGLVTFLFYRAWRPVGDASLLILPVLAGLLVGTCEEWLQWYVPARVGEMRDVFLNLWAIICGLLFSVALDPPERFTQTLRPRSWRRVRRLAAVVLLVFATFFEFVHLGYEIRDPEVGAFRSTYTRDDLDALARDRAARWQSHPPLTWSRLSREDQYFSEGIVHVRTRNRCWTENKLACASRENAILERYFAPVIDTPSFVSATGHRWPPEQRLDAKERAGPDTAEVASVQEGPPIYVWPKTVFWIAVAAVIGCLLFI